MKRPARQSTLRALRRYGLSAESFIPAALESLHRVVPSSPSDQRLAAYDFEELHNRRLAKAIHAPGHSRFTRDDERLLARAAVYLARGIKSSRSRRTRVSARGRQSSSLANECPTSADPPPAFVVGAAGDAASTLLPACGEGAGGRRHPIYRQFLTWTFTLFNTLRVLSYLPTLWAVYRSGDSSQHSLATWFIWFGANLTMAVWLYENNGRRLDRVIGMNLFNASMCLATLALVLFYQL